MFHSHVHVSYYHVVVVEETLFVPVCSLCPPRDTFLKKGNCYLSRYCCKKRGLKKVHEFFDSRYYSQRGSQTKHQRLPSPSPSCCKNYYYYCKKHLSSCKKHVLLLQLLQLQLLLLLLWRLPWMTLKTQHEPEEPYMKMKRAEGAYMTATKLTRLFDVDLMERATYSVCVCVCVCV